ncbi:MAG TPA: ABC transporter substrate-binding protein, partial [Actinomycetota bacterium]
MGFVGGLRRALGSMCVLALTAGACTSHGTPRPTPPPSIRRYAVGGTLRIGVPVFSGSTLSSAKALDPQKDYFADSWEAFRCCLLRTLVSYNGQDTTHGGAILRPDLATALPTLSSDGLTWTFHLRAGLHYGPPLQQVEITAPDIIRALDREANKKASEGGYSFYYSVIAGFDDYAAGTAGSISGLEAPDPHLLVVHLAHPEGDLGQLFSLAATAPIPPDPADPSAPFGVATGHDDGYGPFLVSSGPYMIEGSDRLKSSSVVSGYVPGKSLILVRNPSWRASTDPLRPAYADRIELLLGGDLDADSAKLDDGTLDLVMYPGPYPQAPASQIDRYRADPSLGSIVVEPRDFLRYISMNLAVPPLDDIHVRKAINFAVDKAAAREAFGGPDSADIIGHIVLNSLENNLLLHYDPYAGPGDHGDLAAARREMALSKYDSDHDGLCDAAVCDGLEALVFDFPQHVKTADAISGSLAGIGIKL